MAELLSRKEEEEEGIDGKVGRERGKKKRGITFDSLVWYYVTRVARLHQNDGTAARFVQQVHKPTPGLAYQKRPTKWRGDLLFINIPHDDPPLLSTKKK